MELFNLERTAKRFAGRRVSRRHALIQGGTSIAAASLGAFAAAGTSAPTSAQDATPAASGPESNTDHGPTMLFVQTYQSGTITPIEGVDGRYTLSLEAGHGQTIYFSDRPDRIVGATDTPRFLEGLGFPADNPPNAALVVETAPGETDVAVVELFNPVYDPVSRGVTYEVEVLGNWQSELEMEFTEAPTDLATLAPSFGSAQLLIDDCPGDDIGCYKGVNWDSTYIGNIPDQEHDGFCYSWTTAACLPCKPWIDDSRSDLWPSLRSYWGNICNAKYPKCQGSCYAYPLCSIAGWCDPFWA